MIIVFSLCSCGSYRIENKNYSVPYLDASTSNKSFSTNKENKNSSANTKTTLNAKTHIDEVKTEVENSLATSNKESNNEKSGNANKTNSVKKGVAGVVGKLKVTAKATCEQTLATTEQAQTETTTLAPLKDTDTAYITKYGKKYHRDNCSYLYKSKIAIIVGDAKQKGYTPCSLCKP